MLSTVDSSYETTEPEALGALPPGFTAVEYKRYAMASSPNSLSIASFTEVSEPSANALSSAGVFLSNTGAVVP